MQHTDHAGHGEPAMNLDAPGRQQVGDDPRGADLLEGRLRMSVDVLPPPAHVGLDLADGLDVCRHDASPAARQRCAA
jgi:hypothetical protein